MMFKIYHVLMPKSYSSLHCLQSLLEAFATSTLSELSYTPNIFKMYFSNCDKMPMVKINRRLLKVF